jgi:hypothetical protein
MVGWFDNKVQVHVSLGTEICFKRTSNGLTYILISNNDMGRSILPHTRSITCQRHPTDAIPLLHDQKPTSRIELNSSRLPQVICDNLDLESWRH